MARSAADATCTMSARGPSTASARRRRRRRPDGAAASRRSRRSAGFEVTLVDAQRDIAERGRDTIGQQLDAAGREAEADAAPSATRSCRASALTDATAASSRRPTSSIEAATENFGTKREIFEALDQAARRRHPGDQHVVDLDHQDRRRGRRRPERVIGMHFMNPVPLMKLVEIVRGLRDRRRHLRDDARAGRAASARQTVVSRDIPGFIVNRMLIPLLNEACFALYEGLGTATDIDTGDAARAQPPDGPVRARRT